MAKKLNILQQSKTEETIEELLNPTTNQEQKKTSGRPRKNNLVRDNSVQAGLSEDYTRATFILKVQTLEDLKNYAFTERKSLKDALDEIISDYLTKYKKQNTLLKRNK